MKSLTKFVIFSISYTILFSITVIILACFGISVSDVLIEYTYKFFAGEVVVCGLIKIFKLRLTDKDITDYNEENEG